MIIISDTKKTDGGVYIKVNEDKRGKDHINIYSDDPQNPDHTSIHINEEIGLGSTQYELVEI